MKAAGEADPAKAAVGMLQRRIADGLLANGAAR